MRKDLAHLYATDPDAIRGTVRIDNDPATDNAIMAIRIANNSRAWNLHVFRPDIQTALREAVVNDQEVTVILEPEAPGQYRRVSAVKDAGPNSIRSSHNALLAMIGAKTTRR